MNKKPKPEPASASIKVDPDFIAAMTAPVTVAHIIETFAAHIGYRYQFAETKRPDGELAAFDRGMQAGMVVEKKMTDAAKLLMPLLLQEDRAKQQAAPQPTPPQHPKRKRRSATIHPIKP